MTNTTISDIVRFADKTARERNVADWDIRKTTPTIWRDSTESW